MRCHAERWHKELRVWNASTVWLRGDMVTCSRNFRLVLVDCPKCFVSTYAPTPTLDQSRSRFIRGQDTGTRIQGAALIHLWGDRTSLIRQKVCCIKKKSWRMDYFKAAETTSASWWQLRHPAASHAKHTICTVHFATAIATLTRFSCETAHVPYFSARTTRLPSSQDSPPLDK